METNATLETSAPDPIAYCGEENGVRFAGIHLIIELWQARYMNDAAKIRAAMMEALEACGATLLSMDLHEFSPNGGVSGVAVLQESHISIHTWPEFEYAAMDVFVCGTIDPHQAIPVLEKHFQPGRTELKEIKRGILNQ